MDLKEIGEFEEITDSLKTRSLPFAYVERNIYGVNYQVFAPETDEFEKEDLIELRDGVEKILEIISEEINKIG